MVIAVVAPVVLAETIEVAVTIVLEAIRLIALAGKTVARLQKVADELKFHLLGEATLSSTTADDYDEVDDVIVDCVDAVGAATVEKSHFDDAQPAYAIDCFFAVSGEDTPLTSFVSYYYVWCDVVGSDFANWTVVDCGTPFAIRTW